MKNKKTIMVLIFCCIILGFFVVAHGKESTRVSCYAGDPANNQQLGDLETFNVANAALLCNNVYNDCNGNCTACYRNDEGATVCIDSAGRQFTKQ
jgi:hypothetical protein